MLLKIPCLKQKESKFGVYHFDGLKKKCKLGFISVLENNILRMSENIAIEIIEKTQITEVEFKSN